MYHKPSSLSFYDVVSDKKAEGQDIITVRHHRAHQGTKTIEGRKLGSKNLKLFIFICGKDIPKACFYRTLDLNRIRNLNRRRHFIHSMNMKREELSGVGKKVLPISEASLSKTTERNSEQYCVTAENRSLNMAFHTPFTVLLTFLALPFLITRSYSCQTKLIQCKPTL